MITLVHSAADGNSTSPEFEITEPQEVLFAVSDLTGGSLTLQYVSVGQLNDPGNTPGDEWKNFSSIDPITESSEFAVFLGRGRYRVSLSSITGNPSVEVDANVLE